LLLGSTIAGGDGTDTLVLGSAATDFVAAGFAHVTGIETLQLTGISTVVLGTAGSTAGITTLVAGAGNTSISSDSALTIDGTSIGANTLTLLGSGALTVTTPGGVTSIDGSAATGVLTLTGGTATTAIKGGTAADVITVADGIASTVTGGTGADAITLGSSHTHAVNLVIASGDSLIATPDVITNYVKSVDKIAPDGTAAIVGVQTTGTGAAGAGVATIISGVATFNAADTTFAQHLTAVEAALHGTGAAAHSTVIWQEGSNAYIYSSEGTITSATADSLVELVGVTVTSFSVSTGVLTIA